MGSDTPFDNTVTITWNVSNPIDGLLALHTGVSEVDRALAKLGTETAGKFAVDMIQRLGLVHSNFMLMMDDIRAVQAAMDKAGQAPPGGGIPGSIGAVTNYRMPDVAPYGVPGKPNGISDSDWALVQRQFMANSGGGISPTVLATSQMRMTLGDGFGGNGGYNPADPFRNAAGGITPTDQLLAAQRAVARQDYDQYQRIAALSPNAGNFDKLRAQAVDEQSANFAKQRAEFQAQYNDGVQREIALRTAAIALGRSEYAAGARHEALMQDAGLTGTFDEGMAKLRAGALAQLPGTMDSASASARAQARAEYEDDRQRILRVRAATEDKTKADEEETGGLEKMTGSLVRHIGYVALAAVAYTSWQAAQQIIKQAVADMSQLEAVSARVAAINGQSLGVTSAQLAQASAYGVGITSAAPGLLTSAQFGGTSADRNNAGKLAEIFGADQYNQALTELMQTERRAADAGLTHVDVMGYIATAYKTVPGDMKTYFDALQLGTTMYKELGLTAEQTGLMLLQSSAVLGQSPDQIANVLERLQLRLANAKVQQDLASGYGIRGTDSTDLLKQVAAKVASDPTGSQGLMTFLTQGLGIQGPRTLLDMTTALVEFNRAANASARPLSDINTITGQIDSTGTQAFARLKAGADAWLASLIQLEAQKAPLQVLMDVLNPAKAPGAIYEILKTDAGGAAKALQNQANLNSYQSATGKDPYAKPDPNAGPGGIVGALQGLGLGYLAGAISQLAGAIGLMNAINPNPDPSLYTPEYRAWLATQQGNDTSGNGAGRTTYSDLKGSLPGPGKALSAGESAMTPVQFGGFQDLPKGFNWDKFTADLKKYSDQLTKQVPDYVQNPQETAFWDASKGYYRTATADSQVIQRAMQEQTNALKQITGVFNVPSTGEVMVPFFALQAGMVPSTYPGLGGNTKAARAQAALQGKGGPTHSPRAEELGIDPSYTDYSQKFTDPGQAGVMDYLKAHGYSPTAAAAGKASGGGSGHGMEGVDPMIMNYLRNSAGSSTVNVNIRNTVVLNSRVIYDQMEHEMAAQLSATKRGVGGGAGSQYAVG